MPQAMEPPNPESKPPKKIEIAISAQEKQARHETHYAGWEAFKAGKPCAAPYGVAMGKNARWRQGWYDSKRDSEEKRVESERLAEIARSSSGSASS